MECISEVESLNPNLNTLESGHSSGRSTKPGTKRLIVTLSVFLPFLAGIPVLLKSMKIYRSLLPFSSINSLSRRLLSEPLSPPCYLQAVFLSLAGGGRTDRIARLISEEVAQRTGSDPSCRSCGRNYTISVVVDSGNRVCTWSSGGGGEGNPCFWTCGVVDVLGLRSDDEVVDEMLDSVLRKGGCLGSVGWKIYTGGG